MTVYYDEETDTVVANNAADFASFDEDDRLIIDVTTIMEDGRAERKLKEFAHALLDAKHAHKSPQA